MVHLSIIKWSLLVIAIEGVVSAPHKSGKEKDVEENNLQKLLLKGPTSATHKSDKETFVPPPMYSDKAASQADIPARIPPKLSSPGKTKGNQKNHPIDFRPDSIAFYLFKTRDFKAFEETLTNLEKSNVMTPTQLIEYRSEVAEAYEKLLKSELKNQQSHSTKQPKNNKKNSKNEVKSVMQQVKTPKIDMEQLRERNELAKAISLEQLVTRLLEEWIRATMITGIDQDPVISIEDFAQYLFRQAGDIRRSQEEQLGEIVELIAQSIKQEMTEAPESKQKAGNLASKMKEKGHTKPVEASEIHEEPSHTATEVKASKTVETKGHM